MFFFAFGCNDTFLSSHRVTYNCFVIFATEKRIFYVPIYSPFISRCKCACMLMFSFWFFCVFLMNGLLLIYYTNNYDHQHSGPEPTPLACMYAVSPISHVHEHDGRWTIHSTCVLDVVERKQYQKTETKTLQSRERKKMCLN